ncbi:3351_t:CDS:2 [Ambispora gerdemannii]|uniref:3351_t:CDS:1 n=1 Tax=Ambispora gerdemannii TaxID=144530 RepID=A0A9N8ZZ79_9GLOM|nr:3351_t:CDS:2 [Ambispora gerdemannii]
MAAKDRLAFIGLGNMGLPISLNLHNHLKEKNDAPLIVNNRTLSKAAPLVDAGATLVHSVAEIPERANIIFTSVANDQALVDVLDSIFNALDKKSGQEFIVVDLSTVYPTTIGELHDRAQKFTNLHLLHCPVWGPPALAKSAQLVIITSGDRHAIDRVSPFLVPVIGRKIIDVGKDVKKAASFKLNGNFFIAGIIELLSEGLTLAEKTGLGQDKMLEFIDTFFPFGFFQHYGRKIRETDFTSNIGFTIDNGMKDLRHMRRLAEDSGAQLPIADLAFEHLVSAKANKSSELDWSSIAGSLRIGEHYEKSKFRVFCVLELFIFTNIIF